MKKYFYVGNYTELLDKAKFEYIGNLFHFEDGSVTNFYGRRIDDKKQVVFNEDSMRLTVQDYNRDCHFPMKEEYIKDLIDGKHVFIDGGESNEKHTTDGELFAEEVD